MLQVVNCTTGETAKYCSPYSDELVREALSRGLSLRFKVYGESMHPFIRHGDVLLIEPVGAAQLYIGDIIFYRDPHGTYFVHRLIKRNGSANLVTKGDNLGYYDTPFPAEQVMGRVAQIEGRNKRMKLTGRISRVLSWIIAYLALGRSRTRTRLKRNLGRLWWLVGSRRIA
jgi:signal peptidase I